MTLNHVRRGSGEPLVLVHGLGSEWRIWEPQLDALAAERDVVALDLPGFGESAPLREKPTVERLVDAVRSFIQDDLGLDRPHAAGHSLGGGIVLELARRGAVRSATAVAPIGFWTRRERAYEHGLFVVSTASSRGRPEQSARLMRNPAVRTLTTWHMCARPWKVPAAHAERRALSLLTSPGFDATLDAHNEYVFRDGTEIQVPLTVAWGDLDFVLLSRQRFRARRALPQARHVTLRRCGHVPQWDDREAVTRVILEGSAS